MITRIVVPDVGATGSSVRVVGWSVQEGNRVAAGAPLFTLETDKATHDIEAFRTGFLRKVFAPADASVDIGDVVALLSDTPDEPLEQTSEQPSCPESAPASDAANSPVTANFAALQSAERERPGRILASPLAKSLAREHGLSLQAVPGSGPHGEIHRRDVLKALAGKTATQPETGSIRGRRVPLSTMRRAIARRTQFSKTHVPHFYAEVAIDVTDALALRDSFRIACERSEKAVPTLNDFILLATARALRQTPELNALFQEQEILYFQDVDLGMAVAVEDGVVVPVLHAADRFDLWSLAAATSALRSRAKAGQLTANDLAGGALTVSNLGMHGLDRFTAVINPPQAAALAVGAARPRPAVYHGQLAVRTLLEATLSLDHRLADGVVAARFLQELRRLLEEPTLLTTDDNLPRGDP